MKRFGDLGIRPVDDRKIFNCQQVSISDVINCEIEIVDFIPNMKTLHGDGRCLVKYKYEGIEGKFFTNSSSIKGVLEAVPPSEFPFMTTIRSTKCGNGKIYQFT